MVLLDDTQTSLLKPWIVRKLEDVSDADSDVLADYVLALIKTDEPDAVARSNSIENLQDFLQDGATQFVDAVFTAIRAKSYDPSFVPLVKPQTKKRPAWDADDLGVDRNQNQYSSGRALPSYGHNKRARTNGRNRLQNKTSYNSGQTQSTTTLPNLPTFPMMPNMSANLPNFDPTNPIATFMAMQAAMAMFPGLPDIHDKAEKFPNLRKGPKAQCLDYVKKGFCARGATCPYDHGEDRMIAPFATEYDPRNANMYDNEPKRGVSKTKVRSKPDKNRIRANISLHGPSQDPSNSTIVIERIPTANLEQSQLQAFFGQYGEITNVEVQPENALAVIRYRDHSTAKAAYESPKPIFDNRFVKVFWHKPGDLSKTLKSKQAYMAKQGDDPDTAKPEQESEFDAEEFARRQAEAQKKHEESKVRLEEAAKQRKELDEQLSSMELERAKMADALAKKTGVGATSAVTEFEETRRLKEQLAKLEAEAVSLGIDPMAEDTTDSGPGQSYQARGGFRGRARGRSAFPGVARARHGFEGAVKRLDNRPKTLAITFEQGDYEAHEEALRQHLLFGGGESVALSKHPSRPDTALLEFKARFQAESFMTSAAWTEIPHIGKASFAWHRTDDKLKGATSETGSITASASTSQPAPAHQDEADYDIDDEDRWG